MIQTIGFYQMQISALQTCGRPIVFFCQFSQISSLLFFPPNYAYSDAKLFDLLTAAGVEWNDVNMLHEELEMAAISTPRAQIPSSGSGVNDVLPF